MVNTGVDGDSWLRPILTASEHAAQVVRGEIFERGDCVVQPGGRLNQLVHRRPPGITTSQWNSAIRARFDFVVCDARTYLPTFAVELADPTQRTTDTARADRMKYGVCEAIGLGVLRIESLALRPAAHGRRFVEYVIDARAFMTTAAYEQVEAAGLLPAAPVSYRDIIGRLPDGRSGYVNDLGAVARAAAVDAYVGGHLTDPIIRGLHACWQDGSAEGWGWLEVRGGRFMFERTRIWQHRLSCGVDLGVLAEDLAAVAIGERLKLRDTAEPLLYGKDRLRADLDQLRQRRDEMVDEFAFDHVSFS